jgi:hypothetical protein
MSIIAAAFTKEVFVIATDTLQCRSDSNGETPFPGIVVGYTTKITHYPHLKCCVVALGSSQLSHEHDCFVTSNYFEDITDLYDATVKDFDKKVNPSDYPGTDNLIGLIAIFGYSEKEKSMVVLHASISRDKVNRSYRTEILPAKEGVITFMSPRLNSVDEAAVAKAVGDNGGGMEDFILEVTKKMHQNSLSPDTYVFPVGGEINLTKIGLAAGQYFSINTLAYRFPDYDDNALRIKHTRLIDYLQSQWTSNSVPANAGSGQFTALENYLETCEKQINPIQEEIDSLNALNF